MQSQQEHMHSAQQMSRKFPGFSGVDKSSEKQIDGQAEP